MRARDGGLVRRRPADGVGWLVIIQPGAWPVAVREAYEAGCAAGDRAWQADLIAVQPEERPMLGRPGVGVLEIRVRPVEPP